MGDSGNKATELVDEADSGRSSRTPALAISGVALAVLALVLVVGGIAFALYQVF